MIDLTVDSSDKETNISVENKGERQYSKYMINNEKGYRPHLILFNDHLFL